MVEYLRQMPAISPRTDAIVAKVMRWYDEQKMQDEGYRDIVETLLLLEQKYASKPVGTMMKCLRWQAYRIQRTKLDVHSIQVTGDAAFTILNSKVQKMQGFHRLDTDEDVIVQCYLDDECRYYYQIDPTSAAFKEALEHNRYKEPEEMRCSVQSFLNKTTYNNFGAFLSTEFITKYL